MQTRTVGTTMPVLEVTLAPGERIIAEGDEIGWLTPGLGMETSTRFGSGGKGGFMSGLKRVLGGGQLFLTVVYSAIAVWLLGLAVPVTASYIIAAVMVAPALVQSGVPIDRALQTRIGGTP